MNATTAQPSRPAPLVVGVMGGIGAGKSAVAAALARRSGGRHVVADALGHEALLQPAIRDALAARHGAGVLGEGGEVDRRKLAAVVFADKRELEHLESLTHPWIRRRVEAEVARARGESVPVVVLDASLLLEANWADVCDRLVFVDAPVETRLERVARNRGWSAEDLLRREASQLPLTLKHLRADHVVDNSSTLESLDRQVDDLLNRWGLPREPSRPKPSVLLLPDAPLSDANPSVTPPLPDPEGSIEKV